MKTLRVKGLRVSKQGLQRTQKMKMLTWTQMKTSRGPSLKQVTHGGGIIRGSFDQVLATCLASPWAGTGSRTSCETVANASVLRQLWNWPCSSLVSPCLRSVLQASANNSA